MFVELRIAKNIRQYFLPVSNNLLHVGGKHNLIKTQSVCGCSNRLDKKMGKPKDI